MLPNEYFQTPLDQVQPVRNAELDSLYRGPGPTTDYAGVPALQLPEHGGGNGWLDALARVIGKMEIKTSNPYVAGFGGIGKVFADKHLEDMKHRSELEDALRQNAHDQNVANLDATKDARKRALDLADLGSRERIKQKYAEPKAAKVETVDMQMVTANPKLTMADIGKPVTDPSIAPKMGVRPSKPYNPAEARAIAAEERKAAAAERANLNTQATTLNQISNRYDTDKGITSYNEIRSNLATATEAAKQRNGVGDLALVFAYQRSLEPGNPNVVREGEVTTARKAIGRLELAKSMPARFFSGDNFTDEGRRYILNFMHDALAARRPLFDTANKQFERQADAIEVDPSLFIRSFPEDTTTGGFARPPGYVSPAAPANSTMMVSPSGERGWVHNGEKPAAIKRGWKVAQ